MQKIQMKKLTNYRPIFILALALMIACAFALVITKTSSSKLILFIVLISLSVIFLFIRIFTKIKIFNILTLVCFFACLPFLNLYIKSIDINNNLKFNNIEIVVTGKICENKLYDEKSLYVELTDITIFDEFSKSSEEIKISGKISFYVNANNLDLSKLKNGRYITVSGSFNFYSYEDGNILKSINKLCDNIVATGQVNFYDIQILDRFEPTIRDKVRTSVENKLSKFAGSYYDIGYTMIFGDSSNLDDTVVDVFRSAGIAHILAVSGLHVSIIVFAINYLLKLIRSPKALNIIILAAILSFYCYLCDFSISVIRSSLMAVFFAFTLFRGKPYDRLTSLSLIALIVLCINPLQLFSISFVLSFSAVLSIILLVSPMTRFFRKLFYKPVADTLALISAVQIMMFIASIYYFGKYPVLGIITNFISIPIMSLSFILLIIILLISYVMPFLNALLGFFSILMSVVVKFNYYITSLNLVIDFVNIKFVAIICTILIMYILSDYVFIKRNTKVQISLVMILVCIFIRLMFLI